LFEILYEKDIFTMERGTWAKIAKAGHDAQEQKARRQLEAGRQWTRDFERQQRQEKDALRNRQTSRILRNFADLNGGMLRVCAICHLPWFPEMIYWVSLPVLVLVFPLLILFTLIENSNLEKIELCATIHTFFNELQPVHIPFQRTIAPRQC
jgi:hypothetical protein